MAHAPVNAIFSKYGNSGTLDISAYSRTGTALTDPNLAQVSFAQTLNQSIANILFGEDDEAMSSVFGGSSALGSTSDQAALFGGASSPTELSALMGQQSSLNTSPAYLELIARSNLIDKTVTYYNPSNTKETLSGTVQNISVENGILKINVDGATITPEYLKSVE